MRPNAALQMRRGKEFNLEQPDYFRSMLSRRHLQAVVRPRTFLHPSPHWLQRSLPLHCQSQSSQQIRYLLLFSRTNKMTVSLLHRSSLNTFEQAGPRVLLSRPLQQDDADPSRVGDKEELKKAYPRSTRTPVAACQRSAPSQ